MNAVLCVWKNSTWPTKHSIPVLVATRYTMEFLINQTIGLYSDFWLKVCLWCWHQIKNEYNGLCPACRKPYLEAPKQMRLRSEREEYVLYRQSTVNNVTDLIIWFSRTLNIKAKAKKQKEKVDRRSVVTVSKTAPMVNNRALADIRVMQRNLVYVIGLPEHFADEEVCLRVFWALRSNPTFCFWDRNCDHKNCLDSMDESSKLS